ncbi:MAG TPA: tetratricopeptide repeat protein [Rudaea sp.]|nr:tetratricopeptide repeat protein [Rudaea sp.]
MTSRGGKRSPGKPDPAQSFALAEAAFKRADYAQAFALADAVLKHVPAMQPARILHLNSALKLERWTQAIADLETLLATARDAPKLNATLAECWLRLGNSLRESAPDRAIVAYRRACEVQPIHPDAHFNAGVLLVELGRAREAIAELERAVQQRPDDIAAVLWLAEARVACGDDAAALAMLAAAPLHDGGLRERAAKLALDAGAPALAARIAQEAAGAPWLRVLARRLRADGEAAAARAVFAAARDSARDPIERLRVDLDDALALPAIHADRDALEAARADFSTRLATLIADYPPPRLVRLGAGADDVLRDIFLLAYQGENDRALARQFGEWLAQSLAALLPPYASAPAVPARSRPRIALVSSRWHECTVGAYFGAWVEHLAASGWELVLVHVGTQRDAVTERLARHARAELTLDGGIVDNAQKLRELAADLVVYPEIGMDYRTLGLAALKLAPHQACAWGHPVTTGLPTVDAFLSCAEMEPGDAIEHYAERLLLPLPGLGTRYASPDIPPRSSREALGLPSGRNLYLVPQSSFKLHPDNDIVYAQILERDAHATLVFFADGDRHAQRLFRARLVRACAAAGVPGDRVLHVPLRPRREYLALNLACDVMLDSLHWSGGNTSLDALHCGLPIVTCPGRYMRGRQSMAMLEHLDCRDLICASPQELAARAVAIASDHGLRAERSDTITRNLSSLVASDEPLHALDAALKRLIDHA